MSVLTTLQPDTDEIKPSECNCSKNDKTAEYDALINELKVKLADSEHGYEIRGKVVAKLEEHVEEAGTLCKSMNSDIARLGNEKNDLQWEYNKTKSKEYHNSYTIENQKKRIEDLGKTLKLLTTENTHLKALVSLWIQQN